LVICRFILYVCHHLSGE